jgi:AraC-like DNA-binding protein
MSRYEYNQRAYELARRGNQIKHAKLNPEKVAMIRKLREDRERIREWVSANYSDEALARRFGVSASAVYRVGNYIDWVSA